MGSQCSPLMEILLKQVPDFTLHVRADLSSQGASHAVLTELGGFGRPVTGLALSLSLPRARLPALTRMRWRSVSLSMALRSPSSPLLIE